MSTPQQHRLIGQVIAERYQVVELLAEGGMGAVYIADHLTLHKQVALKVVHPEHAGNTELTARFAREAMATSRIDHPNVISAIDFGKLDDGTAYLAVQLVRGPSLTRVLNAEGALPWQRAVMIGMQIADALCAAHGHGIIHRDLKPDNVLLQLREDGSEVVKVLDFGVAKFAPESKVPLSARTDVTQIGMVVGTPGYMAPEQTIGNPADERSDLYALGVILWESIVGRVLWNAPDLQALVEKQMSEVPPLLRQERPDADLPEGLEALVASLLARRAEDRPSDAAIVREELRKYANSEGSAVQRWRTGARLVGSRPPPSSTEVTLPLDVPLSLVEPDKTTPAIVIEQQPAPPRAKPSVPPPPPPRFSSRLRLRSLRAAWILAALLAGILGVAVFLVVTGRLELRPRKEVAEMAEAAERVAKELQLAPAPATHAAATSANAADAGAAVPIATAIEELARPDTPREKRAEAVETLLAHRDEIPRYAQHMALLQSAKSCEQRREQVEILSEIGDARALPLLQRFADRPRTGCGKRRKEDCFGCLRKSLASAIEKLQAGAK